MATVNNGEFTINGEGAPFTINGEGAGQHALWFSNFFFHYDPYYPKLAFFS